MRTAQSYKSQIWDLQEQIKRNICELIKQTGKRELTFTESFSVPVWGMDGWQDEDIESISITDTNEKGHIYMLWSPYGYEVQPELIHLTEWTYIYEKVEDALCPYYQIGIDWYSKEDDITRKGTDVADLGECDQYWSIEDAKADIKAQNEECIKHIKYNQQLPIYTIYKIEGNGQPKVIYKGFSRLHAYLLNIPYCKLENLERIYKDYYHGAEIEML